MNYFCQITCQPNREDDDDDQKRQDRCNHGQRHQHPTSAGQDRVPQPLEYIRRIRLARRRDVIAVRGTVRLGKGFVHRVVESEPLNLLENRRLNENWYAIESAVKCEKKWIRVDRKIEFDFREIRHIEKMFFWFVNRVDIMSTLPTYLIGFDALFRCSGTVSFESHHFFVILLSGNAANISQKQSLRSVFFRQFRRECPHSDWRDWYALLVWSNMHATQYLVINISPFIKDAGLRSNAVQGVYIWWGNRPLEIRKLSTWNSNTSNRLSDEFRYSVWKKYKRLTVVS